ncbi:glycoside hydrolase family 43 protein [Phanerochaete carnosa HHB-10118-sp]|uniref:arabinan endo-1,5-alpha-L-arabinosidase n=1 Tax=Phanerochaete carnosa (strain HHB-10118-sp) TaxID=650164 RepID=K5W0R8_PHACS|nr:glycoside hydrolase family 43 protein [Phanerochaete carnosa HHB-10118-sp]EKM57413.1 glycoside hydrolase family 43 protein [Phanerochaete carnosa HHB-10118-sp]
MFTSILPLLAFAAAAVAQPNPGRVTGDISVHDPTICKDDSGTYFIYATGTGIPIHTSPDRINWTLIGSVWPDGAPSETNQFTGTTNGDLWAPDCTYRDGQFYLYYAASTFGSQNSGIFFATSPTGLPGSWTDYGLVTSTETGDSYNAIDPNLLIDGSSWVLSLGSFWTGIKEMMLSSSTGKPSSSDVISLAQRTANNGAIEASVIWKQGSFYYLFSSWDNCCEGLNSTYNIRVGRSSSAAGPFVDQSGIALTDGGGTLVLGTHGSIVGPGGQDLMADVDGTVMVYHYYTATTSLLGINLLDFSSGWPVVV